MQLVRKPEGSISVTVDEVVQGALSDMEFEHDFHKVVDLPWDIHPKDYITFARQDFGEGTRKGIVNALSNAKRGLDCQLDSLLYALGFGKKDAFKEKLRLLNEIGILAPNLLSQITKLRNATEHDYVLPDLEVVGDFLDVIELFVQATDKFIEDLSCEWTIKTSEKGYLKISLEVDGLHIGPATPFNAKPLIRLTPANPKYIHLLAALFFRKLKA